MYPRTLALATALILLSLPTPSRAESLYGLSSFDNIVYTINPATGAATPVVTLTPENFALSTGIDFLGQALYATDVVDPSDFSFRFGSINLTTGAFTPLNSQSGSSNWHGLAANQSANILYTISFDVFPQTSTLVSITPTGAITTIGPTGYASDPANYDGGLAYDDTNGVLYSTHVRNGVNHLYRVNTSTGAATLIGNTTVPDNFGNTGLAFDDTTGTLYLNSATTNSLYRLNTTTGAATLIGSNIALNIDGLATRPNLIPPGGGGVVVPLPDAAWAGLALLTLLPLPRLLRHVRQTYKRK